MKVAAAENHRRNVRRKWLANGGGVMKAGINKSLESENAAISKSMRIRKRIVASIIIIEA